MSQRTSSTYSYNGEDASPTRNWLIAIRMLCTTLRIALTITIWLLLFVSVFLSYLTSPVFLLAVFTLLYMAIRLVRRSRELDGQHRDRAGTR